MINYGKTYFTTRAILSLVVLVFWTAAGAAQNPATAVPDSTTKEQVEIINADVLNVLQIDGRRNTQRLIGTVELAQDSIFMYCDSADLIDEVQLYAYDNVIIQQGDSLAAFSNRLDYNAEEKLAYLRGEVILENRERQLFTDLLEYDLKTKLATYTTGGRLTNGTTELRSERGYYYADEDKIYFRDSVVVIDEEFEMRADTLLYDATNEIVYFLGPTVIRTDTAEIYCEDGFYKVQTDEAVFRQNAQYRSGGQLATADTIFYQGQSQQYTLDGRAYVREGKRIARADRIDYDKATDVYELEGNSLIIDSARTVRGDYVRYDRENNAYKVSGGRPEIVDGSNILIADDVDFDNERGLGLATGNVVWRDTAAQLTIQAARAAYNDATGYLKASGGRNNRPLLITMLDGDSLFLTADTLFSQRIISGLAQPEDTTGTNVVSDSLAVQVADTTAVKDEMPATLEVQTQDSTSIDTLQLEETDVLVVPPDTQRVIQAYRDVRVYKSDMQAISDSLAFNTTDSILTLFGDPILWQDTSQLVADTIDIFLRNDALDKVHLKEKAIVITSPDLIFFNQVKGKDIYAYFDSTSLKRTDVSGNAEAIYYAQDDVGAYIGVNKTACSEMSLEFENGGVQFIRFLTMPSGRLDPMSTVSQSGQPQLEGFRWETSSRPSGIEDLFKLKEVPPPPVDVEVPPAEEPYEEEGG